MAKLFCTLLLLVAVASVLGADGDGLCDNQMSIHAVGDTPASKTICYEEKGNYRSTVTLQCDWSNYKFDVTFATGAQSEQGQIVSYDYTKALKLESIKNTNKLPRFMSNRAASCNIDAEPPKKLVPAADFPADIASAAADGEMVIENGKLYYKRSVLVRESIVLPDDCDAQLIKETVVFLSCCADPLPAVGDNLSPPLNIYCPLEHCDDTIINCQCTTAPSTQPGGQNFYIIQATSNIVTNENVQWEVTGITATVDGTNLVNAPVVQLKEGQAPPLNQIGFEQCPVDNSARPFSPSMQYQFNLFEFTGYESHRIKIQCQARLCATGNGRNDKNRPICGQQKVGTCSRK